MPSLNIFVNPKRYLRGDDEASYLCGLELVGAGSVDHPYVQASEPTIKYTNPYSKILDIYGILRPIRGHIIAFPDKVSMTVLCQPKCNQSFCFLPNNVEYSGDFFGMLAYSLKTFEDVPS